MTNASGASHLVRHLPLFSCASYYLEEATSLFFMPLPIIKRQCVFLTVFLSEHFSIYLSVWLWPMIRIVGQWTLGNFKVDLFTIKSLEFKYHLIWLDFFFQPGCVRLFFAKVCPFKLSKPSKLRFYVIGLSIKFFLVVRFRVFFLLPFIHTS